MLFFALQEVNGLRPLLGAWGTVFAIAYGLISTLCAAWWFWRSNEASSLRSTVTALKTEAEVYKTQAERLAIDVGKANSLVGELKAKTDLSLFSQENREEHRAIVSALKELADGESDRHAQILKIVSENTKALLGFQSQMAGVFDTNLTNFREISRILQKVAEALPGEKK